MCKISHLYEFAKFFSNALGLTVTHFHEDYLLDWSLTPNWAQLMITTNCCQYNMAKV